ncbi:MAG: polyprenyl synthetase family protein [Candidatus Woesebacteria bacterium]|jgi:geranylgeranyl diphosphate synthase type I
MSTLDVLGGYKKDIDVLINSFCDGALKQAERDFTPYSRDSIDILTSLLKRGGKRTRGSLVICGYKMLGGKDYQMILRAAVATEMIHAYLLIIDDIADNSLTRRGGSTAHESMKNYHKVHNMLGDSNHFGRSIAMHAGLTGCHEAFKQIGQLDVADEIKNRATTTLHENLLITINGQYNDIFNEALHNVSEQQVLRVLTWKTAYYSFLSPLQFGAMLAGAKLEQLEALKDYSVNSGLAFQIADDILGTFGNEFESGKSAKDDLREGKQTILVAHAMQKATPEQKNRFKNLLGKADLADDEHEEAKKIIQQTGALDYAKILAKKYAQQAVAALDSMPDNWKTEQVEFLRDLTEYIINRSV